MIKRGGENIVVCSVRVSLVYIHIYGRDCVYQSSMLWCGCVAPLLLLLFSHSLSRGPPPPTKSSLYPGWIGWISSGKLAMGGGSLMRNCSVD